MAEPENLFDVIQQRAQQIVEFHGITHGITFTADERDAIEVGMSSGIHAAIEEAVNRGWLTRTDGADR